MTVSRISTHFEVVHTDGTRVVLESPDVPLDPHTSPEFIRRSVQLAVAFLVERMEAASARPAEHHGAD